VGSDGKDDGRARRYCEAAEATNSKSSDDSGVRAAGVRLIRLLAARRYARGNCCSRLQTDRGCSTHVRADGGVIASDRQDVAKNCS
jgi:hypothetical protein